MGQRANRLIPWGLAALSGVLYFLSFVGFDQFYLTWIAFVPVLWALRTATPKRALLLGMVFGHVMHLGGYPWIVHLLMEFAYLPRPVAVIGYVLLTFVQGFTWAIWAWATRKGADVTGLPLGVVAVFAAVATEFAYPQIFPSYTANAQQPFTAITQIADLGGVHAVNLLLALVNGALYELLAARVDKRRPPWRFAAVASAAFALSLGYGLVRIPMIEAAEAAAPKLRVGIAQNGIGAGSAHREANEGLRRLQRQTADLASRGAQLVIWPESGFRGAIPEALTQLPPDLTGARVPVIVGALRRRATPGSAKRISLNSAVMADADGKILGAFNKTYLLMFGEYIPMGELFPIVYQWSPYSAHFARGTTTDPLPLGDWRIGTYICYEDILPRFVREIMAERGGVVPHLMANLTNDSWYGDSHEPWIHLALSTFRSIEHRRWLARATNTGLSAFVDSAGRVRAKTANFVEATLLDEVPMLGGTTVYGRVGDVVGWLSLLGLAAILGYGRTRRGQPARK